MPTIDTLLQLVEEVRDLRTGGYDVEFDVLPNREAHRVGDGFFTVIKVSTNYPVGSTIEGNWWFDAEGLVVQVL